MVSFNIVIGHHSGIAQSFSGSAQESGDGLDFTGFWGFGDFVYTGSRDRERLDPTGYTKGRHSGTNRLAYFPPYFRHTAEGEWRGCQDDLGAFAARQ